MNDLIERQAAIDFIAAGHLCNPNEPRWSDNEVVNFLKSRPSAQPDVPDTNVGDMISRQAAIDEIKRWIGYIDEDMILRIQTGLKKVPSAQRTGRWKVSYLPKGKMKYCSECGFGQYIADERQYGYCPNCGARMETEVGE